MTKSSSADLRKQIMSAGIAYVPADQVFYSDFPYKVELSPRFKGLGGVSGKRGCQIDISNPEKARSKLADFNDKMEKIISNVEYREEIIQFVKRLPQVEYKTRMGGENNLFYFRDPELVMLVVKRYGDVINSVTGPLNDDHEDTLEEVNTMMRDKLYFKRFRYLIEFDKSGKFVEDGTAQAILDYLTENCEGNWRDHKLQSIIKFYDIHGSVSAPSLVRPRLGTPMANASFASLRAPISFPPRSIIIYLTDPNDYVYIKLMAGEYIKRNHQVVLFDELT